MRAGKRQAALTPVAAPRCIVARALNKTALNLWFAREVLVHEAALIRYLVRLWPNCHEVHDLRQEIYVRVYEAARQQHPVAARAFLFSTARNLIIDRARRSRIVTIQSVGDLAGFDVLVDELTPERRFAASQEFSLLARAFRRLPLREREVIWLRRVDGLAQRDVAARLRISEKTVETHLRRGIQKMADVFFAGKAWRERCRPRRLRGTKPLRGGAHENDYCGKRHSR